MINNISKLFENLNESIYIIDPGTLTIVYMNKFALSSYGFESVEEVMGKRCHDVLQGSPYPCEICYSNGIEPGQFRERQYRNTLLDRYISEKTTIIEDNGKRYMLVLTLDMTAQIEGESVIRSMKITESLINQSIAEALREEDPTNAIDTFLKALGERTQSERVYIFQQGDGDYVVNTFEWCAEGVTPQKELLQQVPMEVVQRWYDYFERGRNIIISDVEAIKDTDPMIYAYLHPQDIHSLVVSPLITEGRIIGFYCTDNPPTEVMSNISEISWTVGHFIVSLLKKSKLFKHLAELSYLEQLTGMQNRHAMENTVAQNHILNRFGVIYCDVMGLKKINDTLGHQAGDALLLRASDCLKKHFAANELYRIGGDEFLVMCEEIDPDDFAARIKALRSDMKESNAMMALGHLWVEQAQDIEKLIIEADKLMYAEKQAYYAEAAKAGLLERRSGDRKRKRKGFFRGRK